VVSFVADSALALTCESGICPDWVNGAYSVEPNATFLNNITRNEHRQGRDSFESWILPADQARRMRMEFELQSRPVEMRREAGILSIPEQIAAAEFSKNFSGSAARTVVSYQFTEGYKGAQKRSDGMRSFVQGYEAVGQIAAGNNQLVSDEKTGFKFGSHTNIPSQQGRIWMESKLINGQFDMNFARGSGGASLWGNS